MIIEADLLVSGIEFKVRKLVKQLEILNIEKEKLININQEQKKQLTENNQIILKLREQNEILRIAKSLEFVEGKNNAKKKLNELVQEIEKCIALLNQ